MRTSIISVVSLVVLGAAATDVSHAQMGYSTSTLECLVAGSEVVVSATVSEVTRGPVQEERCWQTVTLTVRERLKGPEEKSLTFSRHIYFSDRIFEAWRDAGREHLWFFIRNSQHDGKDGAGDGGPSARYPLSLWRVVRLGPIVPAEDGFGPRGQGPWSLPIFTLDLKLLGEPGEILKAARASASEWGERGPAETHSIHLPSVVMAKSGRSGDANILDVPVDHHLESLARRLIMSPGDFVSRSDFRTPRDEASPPRVESWHRFSKDLLRVEGVKALRHFKSEANVALLESLLDDPTKWGITKEENGVVVHLGREYSIRKEAHETLRAWGVEVAEPIIRELRSGRR